MLSRLTRSSARARPAAPVRAVHLGLGGFHRAHQAWYTAADEGWGIAAYTFRNAELPQALDAQEGLYTLLVRGARADEAQIVPSITRAHPGTDTERWRGDLTSPAVAVLTLTVTEAAYRVPRQGEDSAVSRIVAGLRSRFRDSAAPLSIVPCDNVPDNGGALRSILRSATAGEDPALRDWIEHNVSIAASVVDRITPATTEGDRETAAELTGLHDRATVATEPFTEWLIAGEFPAGRPRWESAGARFVTEIEAYERRKLWFLNGAHTLLAYTGPARGRSTVREAMQDGELAALVESWWDTASEHMSLPAAELVDYRRRLVERFGAPGIRHRLEQIAADGSQKIPARLLPVLRAERERARLPACLVEGLAAWLNHLRDHEVRDARAAELVPLARAQGSARPVLSALDEDLGEDTALVAAIEAAQRRWPGAAAPGRTSRAAPPTGGN